MGDLRGIEPHGFVVCRECSKRFKKITCGHLKNKHNMTRKQYLGKYPGAPMMSKACHKNMSRAQRNKYGSHLRKQLIGTEPQDFVICRECGDRFKQISTAHLRTHDMTREQYMIKHVDVPMISVGTRRGISMSARNRSKKSKKQLSGSEGIDFITCLECGERYRAINMLHLRYKHGMTTKEYQQRHPDALMISAYYRKNMSEIQSDMRPKRPKRQLFGVEPEDFVICRICEKRLNNISSFHLRIHNISVSEYKRRYPGALLISKRALQRRIDGMLRTQVRKHGFRDFMVGLEWLLLPLCTCGCGGQVKRPTSRFLRGHHMRMPGQKERISEYWSRPEIRKKYSEERGGKNNPAYKPENHIIIIKPCEICAKDIETYQHMPKRFCSEECLRGFFSQRMLGDKNPMKIPEVARRSAENTDYVAAGRTQSKTIARKKTEGTYEPSMNMIKRTDPERYEELCRMRSEQMLGDNNPMKDPIVAEKVRLKMIGRTFTLSEEAIAKIRAAKQANPTRLFGPDNGNWRGGRDMSKPKTGVCSECGEERRTDHHHLSYIDDVTIELCRRCHKLAHSGKLEHLMPDDRRPEFNREKIMERDGYECSICGRREKLVIHHIDYDNMNCRDDNLIVICRHCNSGLNAGDRMFRGRDDWEEYLVGLVKEKM